MMSLKHNTGFTLLGTVFILLILSLLGVYLLKMGSMHLQVQNYQLLMKRAELASFSALEIASYKYQQNPNECPKQILAFNEAAVGLKGFTVVINCSQLFQYPLHAPQYFAVQLEAKASQGHFGDKDYVAHTMNRLIFIE